MPPREPPIARIRLARSLPRLLALPILLVAAGGAVVAAGLLLIGPVAGWILAAVGGLVALVGIGLAVVPLGVRADVEESALRIRRPGGERVFPLVPGPVTRVRLRGEDASSLRSRFGFLGWRLGRAMLRDEEEIEVVRLANTATAILVPTEYGRLAVAAADEEELLDALMRAAVARQRLEELASQAPPVEEADASVLAPPVDITPEVMTGIERALLEDRLERERADAARAAAEERSAVPTPEPEVAFDRATPAEAQRRLPRIALRRPRPAAAFVLLPLIGAGVAWGASVAFGRVPPVTTDLGRLTALALVLAGPATAVGAIMARVWWPRLVGVVVSGGLIASAFIARALIGG